MRPAEDHDPRIQDVDHRGKADTQPASDVVDAPRRAWAPPAAASARTSAMPWRPASTGRPARASSRPSPTSVSQQPVEPQRQGRPSGLSVMWPTSPAKPEAPDTSRPSSTTPPPTPTSPEMYTTLSTPWATPRRTLAEDAGVGVVEDVDRHGRRERPREAAAERDVDPAEVGGHRHDTVVSAHDARDRHADPDDRDVDPAEELVGQPREVRHDIVDGQLATRPLDANLVDGLAAQADDRGGDRVDEDLEAQHRCAGGDQADERGGATRRAEPDRRGLRHEPRGGELADQRADRAAGQPGRRDEVGAGQRTTLVETTNDGGKVRAADRLAALPDVRAVDQQGL